MGYLRRQGPFRRPQVQDPTSAPALPVESSREISTISVQPVSFPTACRGAIFSPESIVHGCHGV
jgi:hypothetical protein